MAAQNETDLEKRVNAILRPIVPRSPSSIKLALSAATVFIGIAVLVCAILNRPIPESQLADGFDYPVGKGTGRGYYVYRGYEENGHLGEDWNGTGGSNSDFGDPVLSIGTGKVIFAEDYKRGWGNVIIIRHQFINRSGKLEKVDSLYGHLNEINVAVGSMVKRGTKIGTIGRGHQEMYAAHLHFEIRKNLKIGIRRDLYPKDLTNYYSPTQFIRDNRSVQNPSNWLAKIFNRQTQPAISTQHINNPNEARSEI